jgi:hypothetical protein
MFRLARVASRAPNDEQVLGIARRHLILTRQFDSLKFEASELVVSDCDVSEDNPAIVSTHDTFPTAMVAEMILVNGFLGWLVTVEDAQAVFSN